MQILLVDDSKNMRSIEKKLLREMSQTNILEAETGEEALKLFKENPDVTLVLLDVSMPGKGGMHALTELRKVKSKEELPVLMVTGEKTVECIVEAGRNGANGYIMKAFTPKGFKQKVSEFLKA